MRPDFCVPKVCLNLARRPDRRIQAWEQFRREGLSVDRLEAPDAMNVRDCRRWRNKGARACAAAHRLAWRAARRVHADAVMVFEDDVVLCRGFGERLAGVELPDDWAVLYFGCVLRTAPEVISPELLRVTGPTWDMHAYLLRREVWEKLSRELGAVPVMLGGGYYFVRKSGRAQAILDRIASIMVEAMEDPRALYWEVAGKGNLVGDEPAASMAVVEMGIRLPPRRELSAMPVACFMPPRQTWVEAYFGNGIARYFSMIGRVCGCGLVWSRNSRR